MYVSAIVLFNGNQHALLSGIGASLAGAKGKLGYQKEKNTPRKELLGALWTELPPTAFWGHVSWLWCYGIAPANLVAASGGKLPRLKADGATIVHGALFSNITTILTS